MTAAVVSTRPSPKSEIPIRRDHVEGLSPSNEINPLKLGLLTIQLIGLACLIYRFQIESAAFLELFLLAAGGFVVHYFLPMRFRLAFFLGLSLVSIGLVLGVIQAAWLVAIGLALIGIVHLPISLPIRIGLLIIAGCILALLRAGWAAVPWTVAVWPILSAMFMFRLIVYVYDLKHGQAPTTWTQRLSYFFMLPNVCFPLFPVVDSRAFVRTYYEGDRHEIHQRGIDWILRGLVQLMLYRIVYQRLAIDPYDVANVVDLVHYFVWLFLLYLRVSGQFHVIVGMLHLFGFNLPETHHLYYLASSFTDFWRRINIYWKDFMMKVFYYPMYFRTRRHGPTLALVISTAWVFALTWALHAYQLFWIRGMYVFTWNDILFWAILCGLVTVNALWEARHGRRRVLRTAVRQWNEQVVVAIKTVATFAVICVLWSLWCSESLSFWLSLLPAVLVPPTADQIRLFSIVTGVGVISLSLILMWRTWFDKRLDNFPGLRGGVVLAQLLLLNVVSISAVYDRLGWAGDVVATARFGGLNRGEMALLERGYYEDLLTVDRFNGELAALYAKQPKGWEISLEEAGLTQPAVGLPYQLRPNAKAVFKGSVLRTNEWGMHDQDYALQKRTGCYRIALLGASHVMGTGVERDETFDSILEQRLNPESGTKPDLRIEILNFAVYGYYPADQLRVLEDKVLAFEPDAVLYVGHPGDVNRVAHDLALSVQEGTALADQFLSDVARQAGVTRKTPLRLARRQLQSYGEVILSQVYRKLAGKCTENGIHAMFVLLPMVPESAVQDEQTREAALARDAGFTIFDLDNVYDRHDRHSLWIAEWDAHPNSRGHRLIADRLYELIMEHEELFFSELQPQLVD